MPRKSAEDQARALLCSRCHVKRWVTDIPVRLCITCKDPPRTTQEPKTPAARPYSEVDRDEDSPA